MPRRILSSHSWPYNLHRLFGRDFSRNFRRLNFFVHQLLRRYIFCLQRCCMHFMRGGALSGQRRPVDMYRLRGGDFPAELGIELLRIVSRGLVLRSDGSHSGDGRVRGGPVLGLGCGGLQRLCERLLPKCPRAGLLHRLLDRAVQHGFSVQHGLLDLRSG